MFCRIPTSLFLHIGLAALCFPAAAKGQSFDRVALDAEMVGNVSCGPQGCPPRVKSFGYYHEHWRRWPEDAQAVPGADALSPFVVPDRNVPSVQTPNARDEASAVPRRRGSKATSSPAKGSASPGAQVPAKTPSTTPDRDDPFGANGFSPAVPQDDSPPAQREPSAPSSGFFPADEADDLPDSLTTPNESDAVLPPADLDSDLPADGPDSTPAEQDVDDIFNLDDFSQTNPRRLQRYRLGSAGQLRRPGHAASRPTPRADGGQRSPIQLANYRRAGDGRLNPLRAATTNSPRLDTESQIERDRQWSEEAEFASNIDSEVPEPWTPPAAIPRPVRERSNPLR